MRVLRAKFCCSSESFFSVYIQSAVYFLEFYFFLAIFNLSKKELNVMNSVGDMHKITFVNLGKLLWEKKTCGEKFRLFMSVKEKGRSYI